MKRYNIYYYEYDFHSESFDKECVDIIYLDESETIMDVIRQAGLDHDLYKWLENVGCGICEIWELTSEHTYDFYHIILSDK